MPGELKPDSVVVRDQPEASRLHGKGHFGTPLSGGALRLNLVEAAWLVETGRLQVQDGDQAVTLERLVLAAAERQPGFEVEYLVFRELRGRGYLLSPASAADRRREVHLLGFGRGEKPSRAQPGLWISAWSERAPLATDRLLALAEAGGKSRVENVLGLVDEESDVTYYTLGIEEPAGTAKAVSASGAEAVFLKDRVIVWEPEAATRLHAEGFFGKPVAGTLQLSLVESLHLARDGLRVMDAATGQRLTHGKLKQRAAEVDPDVADRLLVYDDLRRRGLTPKTGFKFGTHFRAYTEDPTGHHAPYLVHVARRGSTMGWPQVSRAVRLSHSVRKVFLFGLIDGRRIRYVRLGRHRP